MYEPKNSENCPQGNGFCYVIANFCGIETNHAVQIYSDRDVQRIKKFFDGELKYQFHQLKNVSRKVFFKALHEIKLSLNDEANKDIDRIFLFILSHGSEKGVNMCSDNDGKQYEKDDEDNVVYVTVDEISSFFDHSSIPSLKGYPKCIFINACRGSDITLAAAVCDNCDQKKCSEKPNTHISTQYTQDDSVQHDINDDTLNVQKCIADLHVKRPSSENMLVAFSCMKGTRSLQTAIATYIEILISTLEKQYNKEHLLDIIVDITGQIGTTKYEYHVPIIYKMDSTRELVLVSNDGSDKKCVVTSDGYRVYQFGDYIGKVEANKELKVEEKHDIECLLEFSENANESTCRFRKVTLPVAVVNTILSNKNVSIDNSVDSLLFSEKETVGVGKLKFINKKIDSIQNRVVKCSGDVVYECETGNENRNEKLDGKKCKIMGPSSDSSNRKVMSEGKIYLKDGVPVLGAVVYQLPIFETTFTKKLFLWKNVTDVTYSGQPVATPRERTYSEQTGQNTTDDEVTTNAQCVKYQVMKIHPEYYPEFSCEMQPIIKKYIQKSKKLREPQHMQSVQPQQQSQPQEQQKSSKPRPTLQSQEITPVLDGSYNTIVSENQHGQNDEDLNNDKKSINEGKIQEGAVLVATGHSGSIVAPKSQPASTVPEIIVKEKRHGSKDKSGGASIASKPYQEKGPSEEMNVLKGMLNQLKRILASGLEKQLLQGCYIDKKKKSIVVDIFSGKQSEAKTFIEAYLKHPEDMKHIVFEEFEAPPEYESYRGVNNIEIGSEILYSISDVAEVYNATKDTSEKTQLIQNMASCTLGCFAKDSNGKMYLLTAMHLISETPGRYEQNGPCYLSAIINSTETAYCISNAYKGWLGGYPVKDTSNGTNAIGSDGEDLVFLDITAFELCDDIQSGAVIFYAMDENSTRTQICIPTGQSEADVEDSLHIVQKWGSKTGLTFGEIQSMDYFEAVNGKPYGGFIKIKYINKNRKYFSLSGDSGSLVTDVMEFEQFRNHCPDHPNLLGNSSDNNAYGLISRARPGKGISFAIQLKHGFDMFKKEFGLELEIC